jgi:putative ABC transport system substrate-binding protein
MRRRVLLLLGALAILFFAAPAAFAQSDKVFRLDFLSPSAGSVSQKMRATMFPELARLGFIEGRNLVVEARLGPLEQLPALACDLATWQPDAVIAVSPPAIRAMRDASATIPIVGGFIGEDPIAAGFAASLAHPGGTVTGIVMLAPELDAKRLQLLYDAVPGSRRIAVLAVNRGASTLAALEEAAKQIGVDFLPFNAATPDDYRSAFAGMRQAGADALEITSSAEFASNASALAALAIESRLPTICEWAEMARSGCLLGYGPDFDELERQVAGYAARIFRGAGPGELPIEEPTHFRLAVNLKTATALGLTIPQSVLARADEVIE